MLISELTVYDFLKEKLNLSDSDAKRYAKELAQAEEKLHKEIENGIDAEIKKLIILLSLIYSQLKLT